STIACRLVYICLQGIQINLFEIDEEKNEISSLAAFDQADLSDSLQKASRQAQWSQEKAYSAKLAEMLNYVQSLASGSIDEQMRGGWIYLSICGLTFARISTKQAKLEFGLQVPRVKLNDENRPDLETLISRIVLERTPETLNRNTEIFRSQPERWLENLIRK